jgi:hypothetical protein
MLENCKTFNFTTVSEEEGATMDFRQKIYTGETGLRRGVAHSFTTPVEAFQRAGFTQELIRRWTKNTNAYVRQIQTTIVFFKH